jgi:aspartokinase
MDRMLAAAAEASLPILRLDADHEIADLWFALDDVPDWMKVRGQLLGQVEIEEACAAVSLVGEFVGRNASHMLRTRSIAAGAGIAVKAMTASPLRVSLFCREDEADELARQFHRVFREVG